MHKIKKNSTVFIVFLILSNSLFGLNKDIFNLNTSLHFGLLNGTINEYVFSDESKNTDNLMSRLDWDVYFVPFIQGDVNLTFFKYIHLGLNGRIGIPTVSGYMQDYDWLNSTPPSEIYEHWKKEDPTELTNYSIHNNEINLYFNWGIELGGNINTPIDLNIIPYIGFQNDYIEMAAYGGYGLYKPYQESKHPFDGKVISYSQLLYAMSIGLKLNYDICNIVPVRFNLKIVPLVGKMTALDMHYTRSDKSPYGLAFGDFYENPLIYEFNLSVGYKVNKHLNFSLSSFIQYMPLIKGVTGNGAIDKNGRPPKVIPISKGAMGGAGRFIYSVSLGAQFRL